MENQLEVLMAMLAAYAFFAFALAAFMIVVYWKIFTKAGKPGWAALIPIYNIVVLLEILKMPLWWLAMFFVPCLNLVAAIMIALRLAKAFGKDTMFGVGIILLGIVFLPLLAFGDATYQPELLDEK